MAQRGSRGCWVEGAGGDALRGADGAQGLLSFKVLSGRDLVRNQSSSSCGVGVISRCKKRCLFSASA